MDQRKLAVVVGGYLGDEGKGKATQYYLARYGNKCDCRRPERADELRTNLLKHVLCIRSSGGTNTGATVYAGGLKLSIHMLPVGAFDPLMDAYLGNGVYLNMEILLHELAQRWKMFGENIPGKVYLSKYAHVVTMDCLKRDAEKEAKQKLGSTKNGVSIAAGDKYSYKGITLEQFLAENPIWVDNLGRYGVQVVDPFEFMDEFSKTHDMVLEGTQGVGLDVNHGFEYPYVSSGSFSTYGLLDGVGYALAPTDVCMVLKAYGSYFGPEREAGHFEDDDFRQFAGEYGTTTKRPRNLSWLDMRQIQKVAQLVQPTAIMLNCMDRLDYFARHGKKWAVVLDDESRIEFDDAAIVNGKLTQVGSLFVETIEEYAQAPVKFLGVGPKHDDIIER
jgi:adenylosuccinate synthase